MFKCKLNCLYIVRVQPGLCLYFNYFPILFQDPVITKEKSSYFLCRSECQNNSECKWFSYSSENNQNCLLYTECAEKDDDFSWVSSQKDCNNNQCFIEGFCNVSL